MSLFTKTADGVFAGYAVDGTPRQIAPHDAQVWGTEVERALLTFQAGGGILFSSKAAMDATLTYAANQMAWVMGDATVANNGVYRKVGASGTGSWVRVGDLPYSFIIATDVGAGTANAMQVTTSIPVSASALVWFMVFEGNTASPVTVAFNGAPPLTIKTNSGNDVSAGGLVAGMILLGVISGATFRLFSDEAIANLIYAARDQAVVARDGAEVAQAGAEAARDIALGAAGDTVSQGFVPIFDSRDTAATYDLAAFSKITVNRFSSSSVVAPATYAHVPQPANVEPSHSLKLQSADGKWWTFADHELSVKQAGAIGDGVADDTGALSRARSYIASFSNPPQLLFPSGIYRYSVSPNWAITNADIRAEGVVRLRYFGIGDAVTLDAGGGPDDHCWNVRMGRFIVEAPSSSGSGVAVRGVHHSELEFNVRGCGSEAAALYVAFAVCTIFRKFTASANEEGWYLGAQPKLGLYLTNRPGDVDDTSFTSYCVFEDIIIEHVQIGAHLFRALGNRFIDGTIEGCTSQGMIIDEESRHNVVDHIDFEVNESFDIWLKGHDNEILCVSSLGQTLADPHGPNDGLLLASTAHKNRIVGGTFSKIFINSGAYDNEFIGVHYNRYNNAGLTDNGLRNRFIGVYNKGQTYFHDAPRKRSTLTLSGSPFQYTNETANPQVVIIAGGTVSGIDYFSSGVADATGETKGTFYLFSGAAVIVTYSSPPSIVVQQG